MSFPTQLYHKCLLSGALINLSIMILSTAGEVEHAYNPSNLGG